MNSRQIEIILERYFSGDTSLEDEKVLKEFFQAKDIPAHLVSLKEQFEFFSAEKEKEPLNASFDDKIIELINQEENQSTKRTRRIYLYMATGIAASILIIMSLFFQFDPFSKRIKETFSDPQLAFNETKRALLMVSQTLNSGINPIAKASKLNDGVQELSKISSLNSGITEFNKISIFYELQQRFLNNKN